MNLSQSMQNKNSGDEDLVQDEGHEITHRNTNANENAQKVQDSKQVHYGKKADMFSLNHL